MTLISLRSAFPAVPAALVLMLAGCGGSTPPPADTAAAPTAPVEQPVEEAVPAEDPAAAALAAREEELARREAELAAKEREAELARREAEVAARERAASRPAPAPRPPTAAATPAAPAATVPPARQPVVVPAGTQLSIEFTETITTRSARIGDAVRARLAAPLEAGGRTVAAAGAEVRGRVTDVFSGSREIGGTPRLSLAFSELVLANGAVAPIAGDFVQQGARESGRDAAKIAGGAIIGAVIGHQVDDDKGKVIGGLLGAGAGAAIAKRTGGDLEVPAGTVAGFVLNTPIEMK